jgi:hypothetical protein
VTKGPKLHVDGITHRARGHGLACGMIVHDRSLDAIVTMHAEGASREVDCMACVADSINKGGSS